MNYYPITINAETAELAETPIQLVFLLRARCVSCV
jgi:hypothetical protein